MKASPFRRCLIRLGFSVGAGSALIVGFNLVVNPYGIWNVPSIVGFNADKPAERDNEMLLKPTQVARLKPTILFLGSSRVDLGLDPQHRAFRDQGGAYNLALVGGFMHPMLEYYRYALKAQPAVRQVLIGLDFFSFNENNITPLAFAEDRLRGGGLDLSDVGSTLMSRDAVLDSFRTVIANIRHPEYRAYRDDGMSDDGDMRRLAEKMGMPSRFNESVALYLNSAGRYASFKFSKDAMNDFAAIVKLSRDHGVDLRVFIPPEHVALLESIRLRGLLCVYWRWKAEVAALTSFWDFSGYNSITTEPIGANMKFYWDASHFRSSIGDLLIDRIYGINDPALPDDFGKLISADTLPAWMAYTAQRQQKWEASHLNVIEWVRARAVPPVSASAATKVEAPDCSVSVSSGYE